MFLLHQISIFESWFLKDHVTLKTAVIDAENSALPSQELIKSIKIYKNKKLIATIFDNNTVINIYSFSDQINKRKKNIKTNLKNVWMVMCLILLEAHLV